MHRYINSDHPPQEPGWFSVVVLAISLGLILVMGDGKSGAAVSADAAVDSDRTSAASAASGSAGKGQVGGPPTINLGPPDEGKQTSPELVIRRGKTVGGSAEIVAYGWEEEDSDPADFCVWVEQLPDEILYGTCGVAPDQTGSIGMEMKIQAVRPKSAKATYIGGLVSPDVASVRISFRRPGSARIFHVNPILGQVRGDLQQGLRQPDPFGFYYAQIRGLVKFRHVRAEALDAEGKVIGTLKR